MKHGQWDSLTSCMAPRFFRTAVADAVGKARKAKQPLSLVWLDVDECAMANHDHGIVHVDAALARLGHALKAQVGARGVVGRVQGAAFAVMLPGVTREDAQALGEQWRAAAGALEHPGDGSSFELKLSGAVLQALPNELPLNLLDAAQILSTRAKQAGRDTLLLR